MNRRHFVTLSSTALSAIPFAGFASIYNQQAKMPPVKPAWLLDIIKNYDQGVKGLASYKVTDPNSPYFGGYYNGEGIPSPHSTIGVIHHICCVISCPESAYYQSKQLLIELEQAIKATLKLQHEDGTIDLLDTNFHSTPDTGFMVKRLCISYSLLKQSNTPGNTQALNLLQQFLQRAGNALSTGGIHTPNHRWVVSAALVKLNALWPDPKYINRINQWLAEHIDLDADGQYTEKSSYGYSALVDRVLITIARGMNKPELYEPVRKNLLMMRYYIHPNGEVVTEASNRQDKGQIGTMENYYYAARYMAIKDNNGEFAAICRLVEKTSPNSLGGFLLYFLEDPTLWKELPQSTPLPTNYVKAFPFSGLVRIRKENWDATILSNNPGWLTFHKGNSVLQAMRINASFFGKGQFQSAEIKPSGNSWVLNKQLEGAYYQPFEPQFISPDGDLGKMPKSNRKTSNVQNLETTVTITPVANGIQVDFDMKGTDFVPVAIELIFRKGGKFSGVEAHPDKPNAFYCAEKQGTYTIGTDSITFGPGKKEHRGTQLRGGLPQMDGNTVYITGITPFKHSIVLS